MKDDKEDKEKEKEKDKAKAKGDEPFAPLAKVPENAPDREALSRQLAGIQVPTRKQVGVPAYPGAVIVFAIQGTTMELHGSKVTMLPVIKLVTTASLADVVAFYEEQLPTWTDHEMVGTHELRPPQTEKKQSTVPTAHPFVRIMMAQGETLVPGAKSRIEIAYDESLSTGR